MAKITQILQTTPFKKIVKTLNPKQKGELDKALKEVISDPEIAERKKGDLSFLRVYKFKMVKQLTLSLIALGSHENIYRDVKRTV